MNYSKIYYKLCERGKIRKLESCYVETHHIIPRSMGGTDDKENLTVLTYREHFLAHVLLCKMFPFSTKMLYALVRMSHKSKSSKRIVTSKIFEKIKKTQKDFALKNPHLNPMKMYPHKNKMSKPIQVIFEDGKMDCFISVKKLSENMNIPYSTIKDIFYFENRKKKYNIKNVSYITMEQYLQRKESENQ